MVLPYSIIGLVMVLYVATSVSLFFLQFVPLRAFIIFVVALAFCVVFCAVERSLVLGLV